MNIAIIGAGSVGSALATAMSRADHKIILGVRDPLKDEVVSLAKQTNAQVLEPAKAAVEAEIIILALPWRAAEEAVVGLGDLAGKIVIDCMNPLGMVDGSLGLSLGWSVSGGETVAGWLPQARIVKTLNQVGAEVMARAKTTTTPPAMFIAGDDKEAKVKVATLLTDIGFDPMDAGDITKARLLEPLAMVWINQSLMQGKGRDWALTAQPIFGN